MSVDGQLWYVTGLGLKPPSLAGHVNSDGTSAVQMQQFRLGTGTLDGQGIVDIDADPAAGFYFVMDTGSDTSNHSTNDPTSVSLISYRMSDNAQVDFTKIGDHTDLDLTQALAVDPYNHVIYASQWGVDLAHSGIVKISYNPLTGALQDATASSGRFEDTPSNFFLSGTTAGAVAVNDIRYITLDLPNHLLYYTANSNGYDTAPFGTAANGVFVTDLNGNGTAVQLTSSTQFPHGSQSGGADSTDPNRFAGVDANGYIGAIAVDAADHKVYFLTHGIHPSSNNPQDALWYVSTNGGANQTAVKVTGVTIDYAGENGGMSFDPQTRTLYISNQNQTATQSEPSKATVIIAHLNGDGTSISSSQTISMSTLTGVSGTDPNSGEALPDQYNVPSGSSFFNLPILTVTGTGTHAVEQSGAITLASSFTSSDIDSGYYASATVKITGGTFSSNENSTSDDHLAVNLTTSGGKLVIGGVTSNIIASYDAASETLTLSGYETIARYNTALSAVQYNTTGDNPTNYGANTTRTVTWTVSDGEPNIPAGSQNSGTTTLTIDAVNDAPAVGTITGIGTLAINEDVLTTITGIPSAFVTDVDANPASANIIVALQVAHGTLTVAGSGPTIVGNGSSTVTLTGTQNQINSLLSAAGGLKYKGVQDYNGADALTVTVNDQGATGSGGALQASKQFTFTVTAVDDAPVNTKPGAQTVNEDANLVFSSANSNAISVTDVDVNETASPNNKVQVALSVAHGVLTLGSTSNLSFTVGDGTADAAITFSGTLTDVNTALNGLTYRGNQDYNGTNEQLSIVTSDLGHTGTGGPLTDSDTVAITVTGVNDAPVTVPSSGATASLTAINEDTTNPAGQSVSAIAGSAFSDAADNQSANGGTSANSLAGIAIVGNATGTEGAWQYTTNGGGSWTPISTGLSTSNALLIADGAGIAIRFVPAANYNGPAPALTAILIDSSGGTVTTGNTINLSTAGATGGATQYSAATVAISETINPVNDPPVVVAGNTLAYTENDATTKISTAASVTDIDSADFNGGSLTVSLGAAHLAQDQLSIVTDATVTVSSGTVSVGGLAVGSVSGGASGADLVIALNTANATPAAVTTLLQHIGYTNSSDNPSTTARTVTYTVVDGDGGAQTGIATATINITAVNDAPVVSAGNTLGYTENDAATKISPAATVTDADSADFNGGSLKVSFGATGHAEDQLSIMTDGTVTVSSGTVSVGGLAVGTVSGGANGADLIIALNTANATPAAITTLLQHIGYSDSSDNPSTSARTVTYTVIDGDGGTQTGSATATINVTAVNDAPQVTAGNTIAYTENDAAVKISPAASVADADSADFNGGSLTVSLGAAHLAEDQLSIMTDATVTVASGTVSVGGLAIGTVSGGANGGDLVVTLNSADATPAAITTLLQHIGYANSSENPTTTARTVTYTVVDGDGGAQTGSATATINVTSVNDPPVNTVPGAQSMAPSADLIFSTANGNAISIADLDIGSGNATVKLEIGAGTLTLASTAGLTVDPTHHDGTNSVWITGTVDAIDAALDGLKYSALSTGSVQTLTITTSDNGNSGGAAQQDQDTVSITVVPPTVLDLDADDSSGAPGADYAAVVTNGATPISVVDADVSITGLGSTSINGAVATLTNSQTGDVVKVGSGTGTGSVLPTSGHDHIDWAITGTAGSGAVVVTFTSNAGSGSGAADGADYAEALGKINFSTSSSDTTNRDITFTVGDSNTAHTTVYFHLLDLDSTAAGFDATAAFTEQTQLAIAPNATIAGLDTLTSLTLTLTARPDGDANESLSLNTAAQTAAAGLTVTYTDSTGVLSITGSGAIPEATLQTVLRGIQYNDLSDNPDTTPRSITVAASDGTTTATHTVTVDVTRVNDSPTLSGSGQTLAGVNEDNTNPPGDSVANLRASIIDPDGPATGIAIYAVSAANGHWEFSLNGGAAWTSFPTITVSTSLLLRDADFVRFVPDALNGSPSFSFDNFSYRAWDQSGATAGQEGTTFNLVSDGNPFSANGSIVVTTIASVNDAPVLTPAAPVLTGINEDDANNAGQTVSSFADAAISDVDTGAVKGIAITTTADGNGHWEYFLDGGTAWATISGVDASHALLLRPADLIRFVPDGLNGTSASVTYRAWDQSDSGTPGTTADPGAGGGTSAFSTASDTATITVTDINNAPVLTPASPALTGITEDQTTNAGQTVASVVGASIADDDTGALAGIAITATSDGNGHWQYSLNGGGNWTTISGVDGTDALLLRATDLVRFVPDGANGTAASFTYHAWDQTTGTAGNTGDVTTAGGASAFSTASDTASITVSDVNDAPVLTPATPTLTGITEDDTNNNGQLVSDIVGASIGDVDTGALSGIAVVGLVNGNGHWEYSLDGTSWSSFSPVSDLTALLLRSSDHVRFVPDGDNGTSGSITYRAWDQTAGGAAGSTADARSNGATFAFSSATDAASISVSSVNDAPIANADTGTAGENETKSFNVLANDTDVDIGDTKTLASIDTVSVASANSSINGIDASAAFTIAGNQIQLAPGTSFDALAAGETATVTVDYTMHDSANAPASSTLTLTVNGVNDAPVLASVATSVAYPPGSGPVVLAPALTINDVDGTMLSGATVRINSATTFLGDVLAAFGQTNGAVPGHLGISAVYNPGNATLTLTGVASLAEYQDVLQHVTFQSVSATPTNGGANAARTVEWQVNDGSGANNLSNVPTTSISLHTLDLDSNDSTALASAFKSTFTEHGAAVAIVDTDVTINDVDSGTMTSATITLTNHSNGDSLSVAGSLPGGIVASSYNSSTGVLTLTGPTTTANYLAALQQLRYSNSTGNPDSADRDISVVVHDSLGVDTNPAHATISIITVNDAPVVSAGAGSLSYTENQVASAIDPLLSLSDIDSINLAGATVLITGNFHAGEDVLHVDSQNGIVGSYDDASGVLTLTGVASLASYEAALQSVSYFNPSDAPSGDVRTMSYAVDDGSAQNHASNVATTTVSVTPVNDLPIAQDGSVTGNQGTTISGTLHASDLDGPALTFSVVTPPHGAFTLDAASGAFTYTPDPIFAGTDTFTFKANDGIVDSNVATETLIVNEVTPRETAWGGSPDYGVRPGPYQVAGIGDFNHDGTDDVLWYDPTTGGVDEWKMLNAQWAGSTSLGSHGTDWRVAGVGDFNGDGTDDVLWRNTSTGAVDEWKMQNGQWAGSTSLGNHGADWQVAGIGDFNGDGTDDVLWRNTSTGAVDEWQMKNGNWSASVGLGNHGTDWTVAGVGDFNHDGIDDVLWRNTTTGQVDEWQMKNGNWSASIALGTHAGSVTDWQVAGVGDLNHDGTDDVFWRNPQTGTNDAWVMFNGQVFETSSFGPFDPSYQVVGIGDFNNAGGDDVLWRNPIAGQTGAWLLVPGDH